MIIQLTLIPLVLALLRFSPISSSAVPLSYTEEINDITDLILERTKQIVISHRQEVIPIPDLDITFKQGIAKPEGSIEASQGGFKGLDTLERASDALLIRTAENKIKLTALLRMKSMSYYYNDYTLRINETVQSGALNVIIKENLIKMDVHISLDEDCQFEINDLNIKVANNYTVQMSLLEVEPRFYQELVNWACENYLTVITDTVHQVLHENILQAIRDLQVCHFILSPTGLADVLPRKKLDLPFFTFSFG